MLTAVLIYSHVYSNGLNGNIGNEFIKYMKYGMIVPYVRVYDIVHSLKLGFFWAVQFSGWMVNNEIADGEMTGELNLPVYLYI